MQWLDRMLPVSAASRLPRSVQRFLRVGPRFGIARGVAVYGPGIDVEMEVDSCGVPALDELRRWLADRGEPCGDVRAALAAVERRLPEALADPDLEPMVESEAALLLGAVLVAAVDGARWIVWPNGHPVVRVGHTELDVSAIAHDYVRRQGEPLTAVVDRYRK